MEADPFDVFAIILAACEQQDGLCMDIPAERRRLAAKITDVLHEADVLAQWAQ